MANDVSLKEANVFTHCTKQANRLAAVTLSKHSTKFIVFTLINSTAFSASEF